MSEVILAFDLQNEPMIASPGKAASNDPDDWLCGRAGNMKKILGASVCGLFNKLYYCSSH